MIECSTTQGFARTTTIDCPVRKSAPLRRWRQRGFSGTLRDVKRARHVFCRARKTRRIAQSRRRMFRFMASVRRRMFRFIGKFFDNNEKAVRGYMPNVQRINALEDDMRAMSDA